MLSRWRSSAPRPHRRASACKARSHGEQPANGVTCPGWFEPVVRRMRRSADRGSGKPRNVKRPPHGGGLSSLSPEARELGNLLNQRSSTLLAEPSRCYTCLLTQPCQSLVAPAFPPGRYGTVTAPFLVALKAQPASQKPGYPSLRGEAPLNPNPSTEYSTLGPPSLDREVRLCDHVPDEPPCPT